MSLKLIFSPKLTQSDISLCEDYWTYGHNGRYVEHIEGAFPKLCVTAYNPLTGE